MTDSIDKKQTYIALWALFLGAIGVGFAAIFVRLSQVGTNATAFWRMAFSIPFLWIILSLKEKHTVKNKKSFKLNDYKKLILPGLFYSGDLIAWHLSIKYTTVANAALLANFMPVFVTVFSFVFFRERIKKMFLFGLILAVLGTVFLVQANLGLDSKFLMGDSLGLLTAVFYASYILSVKYLRKNYGTSTIMIWTSVVICIVTFIVVVFTGEQFFAVSLSGWLILFGYAASSQVVGQVLIAYALKHLSAHFSAVTLLMEPIIASIAAWMIFSEAMGGVQMTGALFLLAGIYTARRGSREM